MSDSQSTADLNAQIEKLEAKLNELLDTVQKSQEIEQTPEQNPQTQEYIPAPTKVQTQSDTKLSRQEILAEYEKGYLSRLEENARFEEEIRRAAAELQAKKNPPQARSTRGSLPKGF